MFWTLNRCDLVHVIFVLNLNSVNISPNESSHSNVFLWHEAWCKKTSTQFQRPNVTPPICFNSWSTITISQLCSRAHSQPSAFAGQTLSANCRGKNKYIKETPSLMSIEVKCSTVLIWGPARAYLSTRAVWGLNKGATQQPHCSVHMKESCSWWKWQQQTCFTTRGTNTPKEETLGAGVSGWNPAWGLSVWSLHSTRTCICG